MKVCSIFLFFYLWASNVYVLAEAFTQDLLEDELWDDGLAEISVFDAIEVRYGMPRKTEVRHILVKEMFSAKAMVKADDWREKGAYEVIKLNQVIKVPTGSYDYYQMHSNFWHKKTGNLIKFSLASIDSCGNTYKEGRIEKGKLNYTARTYWQGMDQVEKKLKLPDDLLFYDELPWKLRTMAWKDGKSFTALLMTTTVTNKADSLKPESVQISVKDSPQGWLVLVEGESKDQFLFDKSSPHELVEWKKRDGGKLVKRTSLRIPYWQLNKPGDEEVYGLAFSR
ncbi:MAG: hypothetical protein AAGA18_04120 [Verrucomicrobiota bacterium]